MEVPDLKGIGQNRPLDEPTPLAKSAELVVEADSSAASSQKPRHTLLLLQTAFAPS